MIHTITNNAKEWAEICARIDARRRADALRLSYRRTLFCRVRKFIRVTTGL